MTPLLNSFPQCPYNRFCDSVADFGFGRAGGQLNADAQSAETPLHARGNSLRQALANAIGDAMSRIGAVA
jgi:hypothetical protein